MFDSIDVDGPGEFFRILRAGDHHPEFGLRFRGTQKQLVHPRLPVFAVSSDVTQVPPRLSAFRRVDFGIGGAIESSDHARAKTPFDPAQRWTASEGQI